jgi:hypothetical protein
MKTIVLCICFLFCSAYISHACESPEEAVQAYLRYDFDGERLGSDVAIHIYKYVTDSDHESAWDMETLTTGYSIVSMEEKGKTAEITVLFRNAWEVTSKFEQKSVKDEKVTLHLNKIGNCWKVGPPFYQPHVKSDVAARHFETLLQKDKLTAQDWVMYTQGILGQINIYRSIYSEPAK